MSDGKDKSIDNGRPSDEVAAAVSAAEADESYRAVAERERLKRIADFERALSETTGGSDEQTKPVASPRQAAEHVRKADGKKKNIHAGHRARLRESARRDAELVSFSDIEILELLLSNAVPRKDTNPIAHALLDKFGSLLGAIRAPYSELIAIPYMTEKAARLLGILPIIAMRDDASEVRMPTHFDLASLMISLFVGDDDCDCVYAVFLDGEFGILALERHETKKFVDRAAIVGSTCKYGAKYVLTARRGGEKLPDVSELTAEISALKELVGSVEATLLDCMIVCDFGYYTLGTTALVGETPEFVFLPLQSFSRSPELVMKIVGRKVAAKARENATEK